MFEKNTNDLTKFNETIMPTMSDWETYHKQPIVIGRHIYHHTFCILRPASNYIKLRQWFNITDVNWFNKVFILYTRRFTYMVNFNWIPLSIFVAF